MRKLVFVVCLCMLSVMGQAQSTLQQKLYYTCKVWGFVKYYHSEVSTCHVNWDSVLISVLPAVRSATTDSEFNDALDTMLMAAGPMALSSTYFPDTLPAELKRNRDWSWIASSVFRTDVRAILDTIRNNFRPHLSCMVSPGAFTGSFNTTWGGYLEFPPDTVMLKTNTFTSYPDQDHRLLMMFKFWNIVRYFNPYNYVLDVPWDTTLAHYVVPVANVSNAQNLFMLYLKMATAMDDAHVYAFTYSFNYLLPPGYYRPKIRLQYIGGEYVVINSLEAGVNVGDAIVSVDGLTPAQWEDSLKPYYSSGNLSVFRRSMCNNMLRRMSAGLNESIVLTDSAGVSHTVSVTTINPNAFSGFFYDNYYPADSLVSINWVTMPCDVGYVNMGNLQQTDVNAMYADLQSKSAIIFDMRNYPNGTAWQLADLMYPYPQEFAKFAEPNLSYPGTYSWYHDYLGTSGPSAPYAGKVIVLVNEQTQSQAEFSSMILRKMPGAVIVGSQTAGADGDVTWMQTSYDMKFGWTTLGTYYPNGDSTQRIGIIPDSLVHPTKAGIRHHRDEVLEKALAIAGCNLGIGHFAGTVPEIKAYPNPAHDMLTVEATNISAARVTISLTDVSGRVYGSREVNASNSTASTTFDVRNFALGMYFISVTVDGRKYMIKLLKE